MPFKAFTPEGIKKEERAKNRLKMTIVTVNLPRIYLFYIAEILEEEDPMYPSRSEFVRRAVKEAIIKDLEFKESLREHLSQHERRRKKENQRERVRQILQSKYNYVRIPQIEHKQKGMNEG